MFLLAALCAGAPAGRLSVPVTSSGAYSLAIDGTKWFDSAPTAIVVNAKTCDLPSEPPTAVGSLTHGAPRSKKAVTSLYPRGVYRVWSGGVHTRHLGLQ